MNKKLYYIFLFLTIILLFSNHIISKENIIKDNNISNPINSSNEDIDETINTPIFTVDINDNTAVVYIENTIIDTLTFDEGVEMDNIKKINDTYYALGTKNNDPFMETFKIDNKKIVSENNSYSFARISGKFVDIVSEGYYLTTTILDENGKLIEQSFMQTDDGFIPFYKKNIAYNYYKDSTIEPKYIVIHETNNTNVGADALGHYNYWNTNPSANASTHFVVDNTQVYQMIELNKAAWHVGDNKGYSDITNFNSIGIEICVNEDGNYEEARKNAIELTIQLMKALNIDISNLKRHFDASGKICPRNMILQPELWIDFSDQVKTYLEENRN